MSLTTELRERLADANLTMERFREIANRLLAYGVLVRDEDKTEQLLYDEARRIESSLAEYFEIIGLNLHHDVNAQFFRLYAPGAVADGVVPDDHAPVPSLRAQLSSDFVAAALALRFLYQEKLNQGLIDQQAEVMVNFEDLAVTLRSQIKRELPVSKEDRMGLLRDLKRHRLIHYLSTFSIDDEDAYLVIRPTILGIVSNEALAAALDADGAIEQAEQAQETQE